MIRHARHLAAGLLALLLLGAALPFGGALPAALTALEAVSFLALALALAAPAGSRQEPAADAGEPAAAGPDPLRSLARVAPGLLALLGVALLGLLQSLPWPAAAVAALSPEHARLAAQATELLAPSDAGAMAAVPGLSLAASASRAAALSFAALAAALAAGALVGRDRQRRRWLLAALLAAALFQVFFGARGWFARSNEIWGLEVPGGTERLRGTFVNPDHLALFLGLALPVVFAWGWWAVRRARAEILVERQVIVAAPPVLVWLTLFAGLAFTGSRAGLAAAVATVALQGVLLAAATRRARLAPVGAAAAAIGLGVVAMIGLQEGLGRFLATSPYEVAWSARRQVYAATLELWQLFPVSGAGLGTFREAFPLVQPPGLANLWRHAHSGPLEVLATIGVLGALLLAAGFVAQLAVLAGVLRDGRRSEDRAAGLAALGMLAAVAIHEAFDFGLTLPANAFSLAVLAGAAAAAKRAGDPRDRRLVSAGSSASSSDGAEQGDRSRQDRAARHAADIEQVEPGRDAAAAGSATAGGSSGSNRPGRDHRRPSRRRRH